MDMYVDGYGWVDKGSFNVGSSCDDVMVNNEI